MTQAMTTSMDATTGGPVVTADQLDLIRRTIAKDATADELKLYLYDCQRQGVHPLDKLIHFTKRSGKYTPVTSIDFMRLRAAETNEYAGSDDAVFSLQPPEPSFAASVTVWRLVQGTRCAFTATARWAEYKPEQNDFMWRKMPHTMLGKCAEALALRKGFPRQLAGLYAKEELDQADSPRGYIVEAPPAGPAAIPAEGGDHRQNASAPNAGDSATVSSARPARAPAEPPAPSMPPASPATATRATIPSVPNGAGSGVSLPAGADLIVKVEQGSGGVAAFLWTAKMDLGGPGLFVYPDQLAVLAAEVCQLREPVILTTMTPASGKTYVKKIERVEPPSFDARAATLARQVAHAEDHGDGHMPHPGEEDIPF